MYDKFRFDVNLLFYINRGRNKYGLNNFNDDLKEILNDGNHELLSIPYNEFKNIKVIGKGGFSTVYSAEWSRGDFVKLKVALKSLHKTNYDEFINEVIVLLFKLFNYCIWLIY